MEATVPTQNKDFTSFEPAPGWRNIEVDFRDYHLEDQIETGNPVTVIDLVRREIERELS